MKILIVGATSDIAREVARLYASDKTEFILLARSKEKLKLVANDLNVRGTKNVEFSEMDFSSATMLRKTLSNYLTHENLIDTAIIAHGCLPDQAECEQNPDMIENIIYTNTTSTLIIIGLIANHFERQQHGTLAVLTSVAGDRGRRSNYVYGASKKAVSTYLEGISLRFADSRINILDIRPALVSTSMTSNMRKGLLWSEPSTVAQCIVKAISSGKRISYVPGYWRLVMMIIRNIPYFVFRKFKNL